MFDVYNRIIRWPGLGGNLAVESAAARATGHWLLRCPYSPLVFEEASVVRKTCVLTDKRPNIDKQIQTLSTIQEVKVI